MSRKDLYHEVVKNALQKDGWTVTDDPLQLAYGLHRLYVDLGAERPITAERNGEAIAVEIKSFVGVSAIFDLYVAVGQYNVYRDILAEKQSPNQLYLAVPQPVYHGTFNDMLGQMVIRRQKLRLIVFDVASQEIVEWIK